MSYIDQLPSTSRYVSAMASDDEAARQYVEAHDGELPQGDSVGPAFHEYGQAEQLLTLLCERVMEIVNVTMAVNGNKPTKHRPLPRPETAIQRALREYNLERQQRISSLFAPRR